MPVLCCAFAGTHHEGYNISGMHAWRHHEPRCHGHKPNINMINTAATAWISRLRHRMAPCPSELGTRDQGSRMTTLLAQQALEPAHVHGNGSVSWGPANRAKSRYHGAVRNKKHVVHVIICQQASSINRRAASGKTHAASRKRPSASGKRRTAGDWRRACTNIMQKWCRLIIGTQLALSWYYLGT